MRLQPAGGISIARVVRCDNCHQDIVDESNKPEREGVITLTVTVFRVGMGSMEESAEACSRFCARFLLDHLLTKHDKWGAKIPNHRLANATGQQEE